MIKSYLIIQKGLLEERFFPLEDRVSIGRMQGNDIKLSDATVSKRHAMIYRTGDQFIVEDLDSHNGSFLNGKQVKKAILSNGDTLKVGNVILRFLQEKEILKEKEELAKTQELIQQDISEPLSGRDLSRQSRRLVEALSVNPLFLGLSAEELAQVSQEAYLVIAHRGKTIIKKGDRGKSLDIILDGKVRVFTYDYQGKEIPLAILSENQFFGEISLLTGVPRAATVEAVEETLLCRLSFEAMREILQRFPVIKGTLEKYYRERLQDMEAKKRAAGFVERRRHPRYNVKLPVSLSISPTFPVSEQLKGRVFRSTSSDISISGIRIAVPDRSLLGLPMGCELRLEISLYHPWGSIRCLATLRNTVEIKDGDKHGYLGIEFTEMSSEHRKKLKRFLEG